MHIKMTIIKISVQVAESLGYIKDSVAPWVTLKIQ